MSATVYTLYSTEYATQSDRRSEAPAWNARPLSPLFGPVIWDQRRTEKGYGYLSDSLLGADSCPTSRDAGPDPDEGEDDVLMHVHENEPLVFVPADDGELGGRSLSFVEIHPIIGWKRKHEELHPAARRSLLLPADEEDADMSMDMSADDLPDYEDVMGDEVDKENDPILAGLERYNFLQDKMHPIVPGSAIPGNVIASQGGSTEQEDEQSDNEPGTLKIAVKLPNAHRHIFKRNNARWSARTFNYTGDASPLAPLPERCFRREPCPGVTCPFVGSTKEHLRHHLQSYRHGTSDGVASMAY